MARLDALLLAGIGVLLVHQGAYTLTALTGEQASIAHGHLQVAWLVASLGLLGALTRSALRSLRHRVVGTVSELSLFASIGGGYFVLEQAERAWDGYGALALFHEPVFWVGLALAPLVALALSWSLRSVEQVLVRLAASALHLRSTRSAPLTLASFHLLLDLSLERYLVLAAPRRGPPVVSFS